MRYKVVLLMILFQFVWIGVVNGSPEYSIKHAINYDPDFDYVASYWSNSTWNPSPDPADYWMKAENGIVTLYYKGNRTDWGNTEVYQGKKPAFEAEKPLRFQDFLYKEGSGGLNLSAKVKRDAEPVWQDSSLRYPQANIGVYLWLEVQGWKYDDWNRTSSLVIDIYFDSRYQNQITRATTIANIGDVYFQNATPYDKQIHVGYVVGNLVLNVWQEFNVDLDTYIDRTLQKCRDEGIALPSNKVVIKFLGVYVDSFSAAVQASFDYVLLKDTSYDELLTSYNELRSNYESLLVNITALGNELNATRVEMENTRNLMHDLGAELNATRTAMENIRNFVYALQIMTIVFVATTAVLAVIVAYSVRRKPKLVGGQGKAEQHEKLTRTGIA